MSRRTIRTAVHRAAGGVLTPALLAGALVALVTPAPRAAATGCPAAASAASARLLARQCGARVEITEQRTAATRVFANPDGTSTLESFAVPRSVVDGWGGGAAHDAQTAGRNRWSYANSSNSNNNDGVARVGVDPGGGGTYRSYFEFPMAAAAGSRIIAASVNTTMTHSWSCGSTPVSLWWSGGIPSGVNGTRTAWNTIGLAAFLDSKSGHAHKPSGAPTCSGDPQPDAPISFSSATLTADTQTWANQRVGAVTMALTAADSNGANEGAQDRWKKFSPGATVLVVRYNHAPAVPAPSALTSAGTSQTVGCWTGDAAGQPRVSATNGLDLRATLTDADAGDLVIARFEWQDVTSGAAVVAVPDTPAFPSGHSYDVPLPASSLPTGDSIRWRVHGWDGSDNGGVSAWCQLAIDNSTPGQPTLSSTDLAPYPGAPSGAAVVGAAVAVTAVPAPGDVDVVGYYFGVGAVDTVPTAWVPASPSGNAVIPVVPVVSGLNKNFLTVLAVDSAGNRSPVPVSDADAPGTRQFRANPATGAHTRNDATGDGLGDLAALVDAGGGRTTLMNLDTAPGGGFSFAPTSVLTTDPNAFPVSRLVPLRGDFNGDGRADLAAFRDEGGCRTTLWWWLSTGNGYAPSNGPLWDSLAPNWCQANAPKVVAGDLTGDGKADIGAFYSYANSQVKLWVWPAKADGTGFGSASIWWDSGVGNWEYSHFQAAAGDVNGDGVDDIVQTYDYNNCSSATIVFTSTGSRIGSAIGTWRSPDGQFCWTRLSKPLIGDVNGDGMADVTALYDLANGLGSWEPITVLGPAMNAVQVSSTTPHRLAGPVRSRPMMADFNGDGLADIGMLATQGVNATSLWVARQSSTDHPSFNQEAEYWSSSTAIGGLNWLTVTVP